MKFISFILSFLGFGKEKSRGKNASPLYVLALLLILPNTSFAASLSCAPGQSIQSVMTSPGTAGTPAVTHTIHHNAITHTQTIIDSPAFDSYLFVGENHGDYNFINAPGNPHYVQVGHSHGDYTVIHNPAVTHVIVVTDTPAFDEVVIDTPAVLAVPPTFQNQCVGDPSTTPLPHSNDATQPWCSSPTAPGWNVSLPNGGCAPVGFVIHLFFAPGETVKGFLCPFWFFSGCVI